MNNNNKNITGGAKIIPMYNEPKNSPYVTNERKQINTDNYKEQEKKLGKKESQSIMPDYLVNENDPNKPVVNLQVYDTSQKPKKTYPEPPLYTPIGVPTPHTAYMPYMPYMTNGYPYQYVPNYNMPLLKNYNINITGPSVDHGRVSAIFEDVIPKAQFEADSYTLGERLNLVHYIRSILIKKGDGNDIDINGKSNNSLLSYLKFMELNPYNTNHFSSNPYFGLPNDMLIYSSCYPIRYNKQTGTVQCAPNSIGINVRIYRLRDDEYKHIKSKNNKSLSYDVWREVLYYDYVKENILKKYVCPNFVCMHAYYICENSDIDFDKILRIKGTTRNNINNNVTNAINNAILSTPSNIVTNNMAGGAPDNIIKSKLVELPSDIIKKKVNRRIEPQITPQAKNIGSLYGSLNNHVRNNIIPSHKYMPPANVPIIVPQKKEYSGKAIITLTEGPTHNLYTWASKIYKNNGNVKIMVNTGYHSSEVWRSVIMQLMIGLYVMQLHNIAISNFNMENNVYIKDISDKYVVNKYWKYKINGFDYYVPNYGYLLLIDSNYADVDVGLNTPNNNKIFKMYSDVIYNNENGTETKSSIKQKCFEAFKNTINPNIFSLSFLNIGGSKPSDDIIALLTSIHDDASNNSEIDIHYYIIKYMSMYLNNRIGTYIKENEIPNIKKDAVQQFKKGQIVAYLVDYDTYKFAIFVSEESNNQLKILYSNDPDNRKLYEKNVPVGNVFYYASSNVTQNYKPKEVQLNEESLLETYNISDV